MQGAGRIREDVAKALMALSDAVAACGDGSVYPALDAPATAERVLMAVRRQRGD